jgi:hypothetical protein
MIERAGDVEATPSSIVAAVSLYARLNARGEYAERDERIYFHDLFGQMSIEELEAYAKEKVLPSWFQDSLAAVGARGINGDGHE